MEQKIKFNNIINKLQCFSPEKRLLLLLSRRDIYRDIDEYINKIIKNENIDWDSFLGWAICERLAGVVYNNLKKNDEISNKLLLPLQMLNSANNERNRFQMREVEKISEKFEKNNINNVFLKGCILNIVLYREGERISNDTDIMVKSSDLKKIDEILTKMGYIQGSIEDGTIRPATKKEKLFARLNTYEIVPYIRKTDNPFMRFHEVDINIKLGNDDSEENAIRLLKENMLIKYGNSRVRTLKCEGFLLYLCIHLYRESIMPYKIVNGDDIIIYKYMDIHHFLIENNREINWSIFLDLGKIIDKMKAIYYTFSNVEILYPGTVSPDVMEKIKFKKEEILNQYKGKDNSDEVWEWKNEFYQRCFDRSRKEEALRNLEDESKKFYIIKEKLKD